MEYRTQFDDLMGARRNTRSKVWIKVKLLFLMLLDLESQIAIAFCTPYIDVALP